MTWDFNKKEQKWTPDVELIAPFRVHHKQRFGDHGLFGFHGFMAKFTEQFFPVLTMDRCWSPVKFKPNRLVWVVALATMGWCSGWVPGLTTDVSQITFSSVAHAQPRLLNKVPNYVKATVAMEPVRKDYWAKIKIAMDGKPMPPEGCKAQSLPPKVKTLCQNFFNACAKIIKRNGLTLAEFNEIHSERNGLYRDAIRKHLNAQYQGEAVENS